MIREILEKLVEREDLNRDEVRGVMGEIMEGEATPSQIASYLTALRCKGETVEEITYSAQVMRTYATKISPNSRPLVDTCGTGGDGQGTFNVSTTAAFVVAGGGMKVAKHGNHSISSRSGSADLLEEMGVSLDLRPEDVEESIHAIGIGFLYAPHFHPAMAHAMPTRREMGIRTLFNLLGPLTNPASVEIQVMGVYAKRWVKPLASVLRELGVERALVFHGAHGLDELSITGENYIVQVKNGELRESILQPEDVGLQRAPLKAILGGRPRENAEITWGILENRGGPYLDMVLLNAAAAFFAGDLVLSLKEGVELAEEVVASKRALEKFYSLRAFTRGLKG